MQDRQDHLGLALETTERKALEIWVWVPGRMMALTTEIEWYPFWTHWICWEGLGGNWPSGPSTGEKAGLEMQRSESFPQTGWWEGWGGDLLRQRGEKGHQGREPERKLTAKSWEEEDEPEEEQSQKQEQVRREEKGHGKYGLEESFKAKFKRICQHSFIHPTYFSGSSYVAGTVLGSVVTWWPARHNPYPLELHSIRETEQHFHHHQE